MTARAFIALLALSLCCLAASTPPVIGDYILGGTGEWGTTSLSLAANGTYAATHTGCFGTDGEARGSWHLSGSTVRLAQASHSGYYQLPVGVLHIEQHGNSLILVAERDVAQHRKRPSDEYSCFRRSTEHQ